MVNAENSNMTLAQWLEYWLENYVRPVQKPAGYEHYDDNCRKHIIPNIGNIALSDVTPSVLQKFFNGQAERGNLRTGGALSAKSIKNMRVVLDVAMKQALAEGRIKANPVPLTIIRRVPQRRVEAMSESELESLELHLIICDNSYANAELYAMHTGARRGEICALRWRHFDANAGTITFVDTVKRLKKEPGNVNTKKTTLVFNLVKTDASDRTLFLPPFLLAVIAKQYEKFAEKFNRKPNPDDFIFFNSVGGPMDPDNLTHYHNAILEELGLEHKKLHSLRHTFATRGIENGIDVATMSGILGHTNPTTTHRFYIHPRDASMKNAMQGIRPVTKTLNSNGFTYQHTEK